MQFELAVAGPVTPPATCTQLTASTSRVFRRSFVSRLISSQLTSGFRLKLQVLSHNTCSTCSHNDLGVADDNAAAQATAADRPASSCFGMDLR